MADKEKLEQRIEDLEEEMAERKAEHEQMREKIVAAAAVEKVLLEYGIDSADVDAIMDDIEVVDSRLWGDDDE